MGTMKSVDFNTDMMELERLADEVLSAVPPTPGRLPVMPPPLDPTVGVDTWPYDDVAAFTASGDLIIAWALGRER